MTRRLDLADAQFLGFKEGKWNANIIFLIQAMGLSKKEWERWKKNYPNILDDSDFEEIDRYFENNS